MCIYHKIWTTLYSDNSTYSNTYISISLVAFRLNGIRDGCELNSTSSLLDVFAIHSGHVHGKPFCCDGTIIDVYVAGGCCCINDNVGLVVTIVVNGDCFGGLFKTDRLLM